MTEIERYVREVSRNLHAAPDERARLVADLRAHLLEATESGESAETAIGRLGSATRVAEEIMKDIELHYAGIVRRTIAFAIDVAVCVLIGGPFALLAMPLAAIPPTAREWSPWANAVLIALPISFWIAAAAVFVLYFPILEGRFGQTAGKRLLGMRVLRETGLAIGYREAFIRRIPYYFRFLVPDALFIPFTAKRQRAFDIVARTVVVREP